MCRVLIVDDTRTQRELLRSIVARFDSTMDILEASTVEEARKQIQSLDDTELAVHIAIIDTYLTEERKSPEGVEVARLVRNKFPDCYIVLVSKHESAAREAVEGIIDKFVSLYHLNRDYESQLRNALEEARSIA